MIKIILILVLFSSGCASLSPFSTSSNRENLKKIEIGMTKPEVLRIMGNQYDREVYLDAQGNSIEALLYQTKFVGMAVQAGDEQTTPLIFREGKLLGWGRNFYDKTKKYDWTIHNQ